MTVSIVYFKMTDTKIGVDDSLWYGLDDDVPGIGLYFVIHEICSIVVVSVWNIEVAAHGCYTSLYILYVACECVSEVTA